jgi:hypothetical protein
MVYDSFTTPVWIEYVRFGSFFASVIGLYILYNDKSTQTDLGEADWQLMSFSFGYWIVNCLAHSVQICLCPSWTIVQLSLKLTALFSLLLTVSCALSLPLNQISARNSRTEP